MSLRYSLVLEVLHTQFLVASTATDVSVSNLIFFANFDFIYFSFMVLLCKNMSSVYYHLNARAEKPGPEDKKSPI